MEISLSFDDGSVSASLDKAKKRERLPSFLWLVHADHASLGVLAFSCALNIPSLYVVQFSYSESEGGTGLSAIK